MNKQYRPYTAEFISIAKLVLFGRNYSSDDEYGNRLIKKLSAVCASYPYGQLILPDGTFFPKESSTIFATDSEFAARSGWLKRGAQRTRRIRDRDSSDYLKYKTKMMYISYLILLLVNEGKEPYDAVTVKDILTESVLHSVDFKAQADELFLYLSLSRLEKGEGLFDEDGCLIKSKAASLLFNARPHSSLTSAMRKAWPNTNFRLSRVDGYDSCERYAENIIMPAMEMPLMRHYLDNKHVFQKESELRVLFKMIVESVSPTEYASLRPIASSIKEHALKIATEACGVTQSTILDTIYLLGALARKASENELENNDHSIPLDEPGFFDHNNLETSLHIPLSVCFEDAMLKIKEILNYFSGKNKNEKDNERSIYLIQKTNSERFQFTVIQFRLYFLAVDIARQYNDKKFDCDELFRTLKYFAHVSTPGRNDRVTVDTHYDKLVVLAAALLLELREDYRSSFLNYLCDQAGNFSVSCRHNQIAAIYIISTALYEQTPMEYALRERCFYATFARTMYSLQQTEWHGISRKEKYYLEEVKKSYRQIGKVDEVGYLYYQPYFFFLFHACKDTYPDTDDRLKRIETDVYKYRHLSWSSVNSIKKRDYQIIANLTSNLYEQVKSIKATTINLETQARVAYVIQAHLYTLSNLLYNKMEMPSKLQGNKLKQLYSIMFFSDGFLRQHNKAYHVYCQNNLGILNTKEEIDLYLLCGAFRFTSASHPDVSCLYEMTDEEAKTYSQYLYAERGRYKFLLARMLAFSNYYKKSGSYALPKGVEAYYSGLSDDCFMQYDNISVEKIFKDATAPETWYAG